MIVQSQCGKGTGREGFYKRWELAIQTPRYPLKTPLIFNKNSVFHHVHCGCSWGHQDPPLIHWKCVIKVSLGSNKFFMGWRPFICGGDQNIFFYQEGGHLSDRGSSIFSDPRSFTHGLHSRYYILIDTPRYTIINLPFIIIV